MLCHLIPKFKIVEQNCSFHLIYCLYSVTQDLENEELHLDDAGGGMIVLDRMKDARYR